MIAAEGHYGVNRNCCKSPIPPYVAPDVTLFVSLFHLLQVLVSISSLLCPLTHPLSLFFTPSRSLYTVFLDLPLRLCRYLSFPVLVFYPAFFFCLVSHPLFTFLCLPVFSALGRGFCLLLPSVFASEFTVSVCSLICVLIFILFLHIHAYMNV